ncbi:SMR family transporter [Lujinxingia sediminis]|nr:SMR family transporter [Lujinxingia sediminis]
MPRLYLFAVGLLKTARAAGLKASNGFRRRLPALHTMIAVVGSFGLLSRALHTLLPGTANAARAGIGAAGAAVFRQFIFNKTTSNGRIGFRSAVRLASS